MTQERYADCPNQRLRDIGKDIDETKSKEARKEVVLRWERYVHELIQKVS
jgi:hypothetical protein